MKKGFWRFSFVIILLLALTAVACDDTVFYEPAEHIPAEEAPEHIDTYNGQQGAEEGPVQAGAQTETPAHYADIFSSGRARGEYLEDLDHLYSVLTANFPFFGVIYRSLGMDLHGLYHETRQHIEDIRDIPSDEYFANIINSRFISQARGTGHFNMLTEDFLRLHIQVFSNQVAQGSDQFLYFLHEIDNYATRALHGLTDEDFAPPIPGRDSFVYATASDNLQTSIIEPGRIAYVNILQMNHATVRLDRAKLLNFYRYIADFDHLIVDIRQNGGGDSRFFPYLVIAPNIDRPLEYYFYMLLMDGEHNRRLLAPWFEDWWDGVTEYPVFQPIHDDLLERLTYLDAADAEMLDLYWTYQGIIHPSQGEAIFGGKIWLLVSGTNFSASEQAAAIAKQTGFATLVGQTTGGDGIGINPLVLALPNTGVIVRYSSVYGTDPLGHNNQEFGTNPHIFNRPGRDALETVLEIIAESY